MQTKQTACACEGGREWCDCVNASECVSDMSAGVHEIVIRGHKQSLAKASRRSRRSHNKVALVCICDCTCVYLPVGSDLTPPLGYRYEYHLRKINATVVEQHELDVLRDELPNNLDE